MAKIGAFCKAEELPLQDGSVFMQDSVEWRRQYLGERCVSQGLKMFDRSITYSGEYTPFFYRTDVSGQRGLAGF